MFNYWLKCFSSREYCTSSQEHGQTQQIFNLLWAWGGRNFSLETLLWKCPPLLGWLWVWPKEGATSCPHSWYWLCLANTWRNFRKRRGAEKKVHILISSADHCLITIDLMVWPLTLEGLLDQKALAELYITHYCFVVSNIQDSRWWASLITQKKSTIFSSQILHCSSAWKHFFNI